jgi:hypothetical protein
MLNSSKNGNTRKVLSLNRPRKLNNFERNSNNLGMPSVISMLQILGSLQQNIGDPRNVLYDKNTEQRAENISEFFFPHVYVFSTQDS